MQEFNVKTILTVLNIRKRVFRRGEDPFHRLPMYGTVEDPLFLAVDVARILDYSIGHTTEMMRFVSQYDKMKVNVCDNENLVSTSKARHNQSKWFITEYGLYEVCMQSRKPAAYDFRKSVKDLLRDLRISGRGNMEDWFNPEISDPLVREWQSINQEREDCDEEELTWEEFLISKGYTDEMVEGL